MPCVILELCVFTYSNDLMKLTSDFSSAKEKKCCKEVDLYSGNEQRLREETRNKKGPERTFLSFFANFCGFSTKEKSLQFFVQNARKRERECVCEREMGTHKDERLRKVEEE